MLPISASDSILEIKSEKKAAGLGAKGIAGFAGEEE